MLFRSGNLSANLVLASLKPGRERMQLVVAKFIFGIGVFLLPLMPGRASLMLVAAFAALNGPLENLAMLHLMQSRFPPHRLAQIYRLQMCSVFSGLFLAYMIAPSLFGWFGLAPVIMAAGALIFATGLVGLGLVLARRPAPAAIRP